MSSILSENQKVVLKKMGESESISSNFYLSGGTALAEFYLHHRFSEDLDFFSEREFDILPLDIFFKKLKDELSLSKIDYQQSFNRNIFFLDFGEEIIKTEFTFFPFPRIERGKSAEKIAIDSLIDIATNKLFSIYQRTQARDYIDLYLICQQKNFDIPDLIKKARIKFDWHIDPIQLGTQFIKAEEAKDYPRMIKKVEARAWQNFFVEEAKRLSPEILK
jgi:predicted nucleotidyltransferase component of viral defense system